MSLLERRERTCWCSPCSCSEFKWAGNLWRWLQRNECESPASRTKGHSSHDRWRCRLQSSELPNDNASRLDPRSSTRTCYDQLSELAIWTYSDHSVGEDYLRSARRRISNLQVHRQVSRSISSRPYQWSSSSNWRTPSRLHWRAPDLPRWSRADSVRTVSALYLLR